MVAGLTVFQMYSQNSQFLNGTVVVVCLGEAGSGSVISLCIYPYFLKLHCNNIILNIYFEVLDTYHLVNLQN